MIDVDGREMTGGSGSVSLSLQAGSLKFGTSGLRGLVTELVGLQSRAYAFAFVRHMLESGCGQAGGMVLLGRDLRSSSPAISADCAAAIETAGLQSMDCGELPTPALALEAQRLGCPAIMVTGSHIPDDRNGLKFYRPDGEITKKDELAIMAAYQGLDPQALAVLAQAKPPSRPHAGDVMARYVQRYVDFLGAGALEGMRVGVYQHSSVARDALVDLLVKLGAVAVPVARANHFIPVDTEAYDPEQADLVRREVHAGRFAALVSTDGDADRPLVADEQGSIIRGDVLGLMTASCLGCEAVVTPVTSGSVIERSRLARQVVRTRVGSPYVIEAMAPLAGNGTSVLGFEANGGVLLGSDITLQGRKLSALPTRDAVLPILSALLLAWNGRKPLSQVVRELDIGFVLADRLKNIPAERSGIFLSRLARDGAYARNFLAPVATINSVDHIDGVRFELSDGSILHYRASGNAPELRCYVEASSGTRAEELLAWGLSAAGGEVQSATQMPV